MGFYMLQGCYTQPAMKNLKADDRGRSDGRDGGCRCRGVIPCGSAWGATPLDEPGWLLYVRKGGRVCGELSSP